MLIIYLFIIIILILWKIRLSKDNDYLSKEQCNSIKGIFILMIFLTHSMYYINASGYEYPGFDFLTPIITNYIGQLVVVMFLFYSGYGVASQIARKGDKYISQIPKHRILTTVINFDVAVCIFIVLNLLLSRPMSVSQILFSFIAWDSVGNSNWYIFVILICYCFTYIANKLSIRYVGGGIFIFCIIAMFVLSIVKGTWWYDTILAYPAGYVYANYKSQVERIIKKHYMPILIMSIFVFYITHDYCPFFRGITPNVMAITFALIIVLITMRIRISNKLLIWFGVNLFPLYIYQRIPMIALQTLVGKEYISQAPVLFLLVSLIITCCIAYLYKWWSVSL